MSNYQIERHRITGPLFLPLLLLAILYSGACATSPRTDANSRTASDGRPEITDEKIRQNIIGRRVEGVPEETNASPPINWTFEPDEPKEFTVLEKQMNDDQATIVVDMKTRTAEGSRNPRQLNGKLRLHYELQSDFVLRKWRIIEVENISMKYKNEPKKEEKNEPKKGPKDEPDKEQDASESDGRR
jgi:hypothetical protein